MTTSTVQESTIVKNSTGSDRLFSTLAVTALVSTIALIMVGSIVRVTGNGLGCPDWPLCHGQAIPPFLGSAWVEFAHRLFGVVVVLQVGALIVQAWRVHRAERWIFRPAAVMIFVITVQVILGGIHVIFELPRWTGWVHTGVAMLVAGLLAVWVAVTQPATIEIGRRTASRFNGTSLHLWTMIGATATYLLILTGSLVTRTGASLVCPSFPNCGLDTVPDNLQSIVTIQMTHRLFAMAVALAIVILLWRLWRVSDRDTGIRNFAWIIMGLFLFQVSLGLVNIWYAIPMWSRVLHLGTATTIWTVMVILSATLEHGRDQHSQLATITNGTDN